jgi:predicted PurR-regulated permease PerM
MFTGKGTTTISISTGTMIRACLIALFIFLFWVLRDILLILLTAIVIASFVESAVPHFKKNGIPRVLGIVCLYVGCILILAALFYLFAPLLITEIYNFASIVSAYVPHVAFLEYFRNDSFSGAKDIVSSLAGGFSIASLLAVSKAFVQNLSGGFFSTLSFAFGSIMNVILIVLISFYLSIQEKGIENFIRLIFPITYEDYVVDLWSRTSKKIGLWFKGQVVLGLVISVLIYLVLSLIGIQYALLLAIIAGVMELVPYGMLIALIPAVSFSYLSGGIGSALTVAGAYLIVHQFEVFLFAPLIIKQIVGLSPIVIILAALIGFELGGFWGIILSIPVAIFVMEILNDIEKDKILARTQHDPK